MYSKLDYLYQPGLFFIYKNNLVSFRTRYHECFFVGLAWLIIHDNYYPTHALSELTWSLFGVLDVKVSGLESRTFHDLTRPAKQGIKSLLKFQCFIFLAYSFPLKLCYLRFG